MRILTLPLLLLLAACGPKTPPPAPAEPAPAPAPVAAAEPEPEPEPEPPAPPPSNADFNATVTRADGTATSGHVKRVERSTDWFGEADWSTEAKDVKLSLEKGNTGKDVTWAEIKSIAIVPGKVPADADCVYDSNWTPWMYDCTVKTAPTFTLKDGSTGWTTTDRHKWRLTLDNDTSVEFWLYKHPARQQDEKVVDLETTNPENFELYSALQDRLRQEIKTTMVTKVSVQ